MARQYATIAEAYEFMGLTVTDPELQRASADVDYLTRLARFEADEDGVPTSAVALDAFKRATLATLAWWDETGDPTGAISQEGPVKILSVSFGGSGAGGSAANGKSAASQRHSPEAIDILITAGLITARIDRRRAWAV